MDLDLRQAIINQVKNKSTEELHDVIRDSVHEEEQLLPGLGVLFEIIWDHSPEAAQTQMVQTLKEHL